MNIKIYKPILIAIGLTLIVITAWQITGGDYYTKFEIVKEVEKELDPSDPLVAAGFYNDDKVMEIVTIKEFRLGLLPTPSSLFDKHMIAVITLLSPIWIIAFSLFFIQYARALNSKNRKLSMTQ